jgi:hypothetical protein
MEAKKGQAVLYIDGFGREHEALVTAVNGMNLGFVTLVHVDINSPEADNIRKIFDVAHVSHESKQEPNPSLPSYDVNAWKFVGEIHRALPTDHPAFDHPFLPQKTDEQGNVIPIPRPATDAELTAHQASQTAKPAVADAGPTDAVPADEPKPLVAPDWAHDGHTFARVRAFLVSKGIVLKAGDEAVHQYMHGLQPFMAKHFREDFAAWAEQNPATVPAKRPTIAELEAILNSEEEVNVVVNPDGSVSAVPAAETAPVHTVDSALTGSGGPMTASAPSLPSSDVPSPEDLDRMAEEQQAKEATTPVIETKTYSDGSSATGVAPLPDLSPAQQDAAQTSAPEPDVTAMLDQAPPPPAEPEPPASE